MTQEAATEDLQAWVGRESIAEDRLEPQRAQALQATLERPGPRLVEGEPLPPGWQWLYFWIVEPQSALGRDGHPEKGGFLPPVELPRRMWAGSRLSFHAALPLGEAVVRRSRILKIEEKQGQSGRLVFVTVGHTYEVRGRPALEEEHDIVYREDPKPGEMPRVGDPAPAEALWRREVTPDPVLLFRYSALTFNGHRIHYDRRYCREVEGYPGLVVHGPLLATFMLALAEAQGHRAIARFSFRALAPVFDIAPFAVCGQPREGGCSLWIEGPSQRLCMQGVASWA